MGVFAHPLFSSRDIRRRRRVERRSRTRRDAHATESFALDVSHRRTSRDGNRAVRARVVYRARWDTGGARGGSTAELIAVFVSNGVRERAHVNGGVFNVHELGAARHSWVFGGEAAQK